MMVKTSGRERLRDRVAIWDGAKRQIKAYDHDTMGNSLGSFKQHLKYYFDYDHKRIYKQQRYPHDSLYGMNQIH